MPIAIAFGIFLLGNTINTLQPPTPTTIEQFNAKFIETAKNPIVTYEYNFNR